MMRNSRVFAVLDRPTLQGRPNAIHFDFVEVPRNCGAVTPIET
jgi:hypothetical protein